MAPWEIMRAIVKDKIDKKGIKQKFIAQECGFSETVLSSLINGRKPVSTDDIEKFCRGMGVSPNDVFSWTST